MAHDQCFKTSRLALQKYQLVTGPVQDQSQLVLRIATDNGCRMDNHYEYASRRTRRIAE